MALALLVSADSLRSTEIKRGDIVAVLEDGVHPGAKIVEDESDTAWRDGVVTNPRFYLIHVTDGTREQVLALIDQVSQVNENGVLVEIKTRGKRVGLDALPGNIRNQLDQTQRLSATLAQVTSFLADR